VSEGAGDVAWILGCIAVIALSAVSLLAFVMSL
jgi:hypothetical protein